MVILACSSVRKVNTPAKKGIRFTLAAGMTTSFPSTASEVATHRKRRLSRGLTMKSPLNRFFLLGLGALSLLLSQGYAQEATDDAAPAQEIKQVTLAKAAMCEGIKEYVPKNQGIVFPTAIGKILCFTVFDPVPQKTVIYHNWYRNDQLITKVKLTLKPPRWSTFSSIQLREADKGPWRVEIVDEKNRLHKTLRFSITD
jgi:hypothetical protein